jgi:uncharacterized repeat protein (TIGR01451 family)
MTVDKASAQPGDVLTYTIVLRNDGLAIASAVTLSNPLPVQTTYVTGSLQLEGGGVADDANGIIGWNGSLDVGARVTLTYQCKATTLERGIWVRNVAYLKDGYSLPRRLQASTYVPYGHQWLPLLLKRHAG